MMDKEFYIKHGLIYGVVTITYLMITYIMGIGAMVSGWNSAIQFAMAIGLFVFIGIEARKLSGGFINFGEAFKAIFLSFALGSFLFLLFNFVLNTVIDPSLPGQLFEEGVKSAISVMENFGMDEDTVEKTYDQMMESKDKVYDSFTLSGFLLSYVYTLAIGAIGIAISALIVKKKDPNPFSEVENS